MASLCDIAHGYRLVLMQAERTLHVSGKIKVACVIPGFHYLHFKCSSKSSLLHIKIERENHHTVLFLKVFRWFQTYACNGNPMSEICAKEGEDLYIVGELFPLSNWTRREFLFCVYVSKTYDCKYTFLPSHNECIINLYIKPCILLELWNMYKCHIDVWE